MVEEAQPAAAPVDIARALRLTAWTALIACVLLLPLIGFNTVQNIHNELVLETRWPLLGTMVAIVAAIRLAWEILPRQRIKRAWTAFVWSPDKLLVTALLCGLVAALARLTLGTLADAPPTLHVSLLSIMIAGIVAACGSTVRALVAWTLLRYPATTETGCLRRRQIGAALRAAGLGFLVAYPL